MARDASEDRWERVAETMERAAEEIARTVRVLERRLDGLSVENDPRPSLTLVEGDKDA